MCRSLAVPLVFLFSSSLASTSPAQQLRDLTFPAASPRGQVGTTVGFTEVSIDYGRPAINGRKVWGGLVPWDSVWRAGANMNTVITFTSPVLVGGRELAAGRYGLHMIPTAREWTIILSKEANNWGSFSYQQAEDAVRFTVTPRATDMTERLTYTLDDLTDSTVVATLRWERLAVPVPLRVHTTQVVEDSIRSQLRAIPQFFPQGWSQAARWALTNGHIDQAAAWADSSIARQPTYQGLRIKSAVQARRGDAAGSQATMAEAMQVATEADINTYGYELLGQKKYDEAIAVFTKNTKDYPQSWNTYDSLGEAYATKGDKKLAQTNYRKALAMVGDAAQKRRIEAALTALH